MVETLQPDGSAQRTYFWQDRGRAGRVSREETENASGVLVAEASTVWEVVDGGGVVGSAAGVDVGRPTFETQVTLYGGQEGARRSITYTYDDASVGYNFVTQATIERPSGTLTVNRSRYEDPQHPDAWFPGLVASETHSSGGIVYRDLTYEYSEGRGLREKVTAVVQDRTASPTGSTTLSVQASYGLYGNLLSKTDPEGRTEYFCWDGGSVYGNGCPGSATHTHTALVGRVDRLGELDVYTPDLATGKAEAVLRYNGDQAALSLDAFGRMTQATITPAGGTATVVETRAYFDGLSNPAGQPFVETYAEVGDASGTTIRTAQYLDGLGKVVREVSDADVGSYFGRAVLRDHAGRTVRATLELACGGDPHCLAIDPTATGQVVVTGYDALGRVVENTSPEGVEAVFYGRLDRTQPTGPGGGTSFDRVLVKDRNGNLRQQILDGDRTVWVDECHGSVSPGTTTLTGGECGSADTTFYVYEPTGEVGTIYDADAVAFNDYSDPRHFIRYLYDTVGRNTSLQDPDGGTSFTTYNPSGTVASTGGGANPSTVLTRSGE